MLSTAAWSAVCGSPMPMVRADAIAASSTTRKHFQRQVEHGTFSPHGRYHSFGVGRSERTRNWRCSKALPDATTHRGGSSRRLSSGPPPTRDVILNWRGRRAIFEQVWSMAPRVRWIHSRSAGLDDMLFPELVESPDRADQRARRVQRRAGGVCDRRGTVLRQRFPPHGPQPEGRGLGSVRHRRQSAARRWESSGYGDIGHAWRRAGMPWE